MRIKSRIVKNLISVSSIVLISKVFGLVKQIVTASAFGATIKTDLISMAEGFIGNLDYLIVQALSTAFIPTFIYAEKKGNEKGNKFVSNTITVFLFSTIVISLLLFLSSSLLSRVLAPSYSVELSSELAKYIRIVSPILVIVVEQAIFNSLLRARERFALGEFVGINQSIILIAIVLLFGKRIGPDSLILGLYLYSLFNLFFLLFFARKEFVFEISNPFKDKNVTALLTMMGPLIIGYSMVFINQQVDKVIVSGLSAGTITAMGYASVLSNFVCAFIGSICGVLFTYITKRIADKDYESAADLVKQFTAQMMTIFLPISIFSIVNSHDIVSLVFGHGNFDENAISSCAVALIGYSAMFAPYVFREILSRVQYAYEDSRHPMINSSIGIVFNIIFSIILSRYLGVLGVTLATSISVLISAILNLASTKKHNGSITFKYYLKYFPQWIVGGAICFGASFFIRRIMSDNPLVIRLLVSFVTSFAGYGLIVLPIILKTVKTIVFEEKKD